jgi:hypothetical protein
VKVVAALVAFLSAFLIAPAVLLLIVGIRGQYIYQSLGGIVLLAIGGYLLYWASTHTDRKYILVGLTLVFSMLLLFGMSLYLITKLHG